MTVAATGAQRALLQAEFASLTFVDLPGYGVKYGKNRAITILRLIVSIPKILIRIKQEKVWLRRFVSREEPDLVISDNRYGLVVPGVYCVFITHQLLIRTPLGRWADGWLQRINYRWINRFSRCWVPDIGGPASLAGELSGPKRMPHLTTRYIGILSRMGGPAARPDPSFSSEQGGAGEREILVEQEVPGEPYVLVVLSGPEPQRTLFEKLILQQAATLDGPIVLVRGLPGGGKALMEWPPTVTVYDHLPSANLERTMADARLVIARSGYSTVMDLVRMRKRAVLIPTPGQTEQEYLGDWLAANGWAVCVRQNRFSLEAALRLAGPVSPWPADDGGERLHAEVLAVLAQSRPAFG